MTTTETDTTTSAPAAAPSEELGELLLVDPATLILGANVRHDVELDRGFLRNIAERGVREPITVRRDSDGRLVVRKGQRRTLAAVRGSLAQVRVFVEPGADIDEADTTARIERTIDQLAENDHRADVGDKDRVRAHQELLDLGLSAGQIARRTHTSAKKVRVVDSVAASELARAVMARYELTLDQAAVVAEFDDGTPAGTEAAKLLTVTARSEPAQFAHVAQRARDDRAAVEQIAARTAELTGEGVTVLAEDQLSHAMALSSLRPKASDPDGTELTVAAHTGCPGHGACVRMQHHWKDGAQPRVDYYCTDYLGNGHAARWGGAVARAVGEKNAPMSEADKAERRRVIANNKAWDSAATVRIAWLKAFLARKSTPKDAAVFIATTLGAGSHDVRKAMESGHRTACALIGLPEPAGYYSSTPNPLVAAAATASGARAVQLSLAVLLGGLEEGTWRRANASSRGYFEILAGWGYPLSEVETLVISEGEHRAGAGQPGDELDEGQDPDAADGAEPVGDNQPEVDAE